MKRVAPNKIIGHVATVRSGQRNMDPPTGDEDEFGMPHVVGRPVRNEDSEWSKRLLTDDVTKLFRSHTSPIHILHDSGRGAKSNAIGVSFDHRNPSRLDPFTGLPHGGFGALGKPEGFSCAVGPTHGGDLTR